MSEEEAPRDRTAAAVAGVWQRMRPAIQARLDRLEEALQAARGDASRERAIGEAHTLAGTLGTFGFPEGSRLARELEVALEDGLDAAAAARFVERLRALREGL